jgi:hypothetical protein
MCRYFRVFSLCLLAGLLTIKARAQKDPDPIAIDAQVLTVDKALSLTLGNQINTAAGQAGLRAAEARLEATELFPNPEVRLTHDERWTGETGKEYAIRISPPNPWAIKARKAEGELGINLAKVQLDGLRWITVIDTRKFFYEALHAQKLVHQAMQKSAVAEKKKTLYEMLLANGQVTLPTVLEVRLGFLEAARQLESATQTQKNGMNRLLARIGLPTNSKPMLGGEFESPLPMIGELQAETLFNKYSARNPMVSAMKLQAEMAGTRTDQVAANNRLWVNFIQAGYSETSNWWEEEDWRFRAGIHIPLFDLKGKAVEAAKAEQEALAAQVEVARQLVRVKLAEALGNLQDTAKALQEAQDLSDNIAKEVRRTLEEDASAPEPTLPPQTRFRLMEGLLRISEAKLTNEYRYQYAVLQLEAVLGERLVELLLD